MLSPFPFKLNPLIEVLLYYIFDDRSDIKALLIAAFHFFDQVPLILEVAHDNAEEHLGQKDRVESHR